jgi:hypothetical protein
MMTSNEFLKFWRNSNPSPMCTLTAGCWNPTANDGRYFFERRMTAYVSIGQVKSATSSISQSVASLTHECLTTSRRTPPSPPPITRTFSGLGCEFIAR